MKVFFFTPFAHWSQHLGTELDVIQQHLDAGDEVAVFGCLRDVSACTANITNSRTDCAKCISRRLRGLELLRDPHNKLEIVWLRDWMDDPDEVPVGIGGSHRFSDPHTVASLELDGWDAGSAAASSTISKFRDPEFESPESRDAWERLLQSGLQSFRAVAKWLDANPETERAYIFNGRFAMARGALRACEAAGVDYHVHDRGRDDDHYMMFENHVLFDMQKFGEMVESHWEAGDPTSREATGAEFFELLRAGLPTNNPSFVTGQTPGLLPDDWSDADRNIVAFVSSEDEFASIGPEWHNPIYATQSEGIAHLASTTGPNTTWWIRMHPNLTGIDNVSTRALWALADQGVRVIDPASSLSTYAIIDAADVILTFGSTVGIEATFWDRISVRAGPALYRDLDAAYAATDRDHAVELINADLEPKPKLGALKYGHYWRAFGEPFKFFVPDAGSEGTFNGHELAETPTPHRFVAEYLAPLATSNPKLYDPAYRVTRLLLHTPFAPVIGAWRDRQKKPVG